MSLLNHHHLHIFSVISLRIISRRLLSIHFFSVLYSKDSLDGKGTVFLDPNKLSDGGTMALCSSTFSMDGRYIAYTLSKSGSDWKTIHVSIIITLLV